MTLARREPGKCSRRAANDGTSARMPMRSAWAALPLLLLAPTSATGAQPVPTAKTGDAASSSGTSPDAPPHATPIELHIAGIELGRLERVVDTERVELVFRVSTTGKDPVPLDKIAVRVDPFRDLAGKEGDQPKVEWNQRSGAIASGEDQSFTISTTLPAPGSYLTEIRLRYGDAKASSTPLAVVRKGAPGPAGIEVVGSTAALVTRCCPSPLDGIWSVLRDACDPRPVLNVMLRETEGSEKTIARPIEIASVSVVGANNRELREKATKLSVREQGSPLADDRLALGVRKARSFDLEMLGLGTAGVHNGKVRFEVEGRQPLDVSFTLVVKDHWMNAALVVTVGTLASYGLRRYLGDGRERQVWRRDIRRLIDKLDTARGASAGGRPLRVFMGLRSQLDALDADVINGSRREDVTAAFKVLSKKLDLLAAYLEAERRLAELGSGADNATTADLHKKLDGVADTLGKPGAGDEVLTAAQQSLKDLGVTDALRRQLQADLTALRTAVDQVRKTAEQSVLAVITGEVVPALTNIKRKLDQGEVDGVSAQLDQARRAYAVALADALAERIASEPRAEGAEWQSLRDEVLAAAQAARAAKDARTAGVALADAQTAWGKARVVKLGALVAKAASRIDAVNQTEEWKRATKERLDASARPKLDAARAAVEARDAAAAEQACREVEDALRTFHTESLGEELPLLLAASGTAPEPVTLGALPALRAQEIEVEAPEMSEAELSARIAANDALVVFALTVVAAAMGVTVLWARSEAWGTLEDYLTALLWGFGLHQVGNKTFEGLLGLRDSMAKPGG